MSDPNALRAVIALANERRPGFAEAIGSTAIPAPERPTPPAQLRDVYAVASGTPSNIADQRLMDIVPGFRLIHCNELAEVARQCHSIWPELERYVPFLADYSGSYYMVSTTDGRVSVLDKEGALLTIASTMERFWSTVQRCYADGAYLYDDNGYLDYDEDHVARIGAAMNPGCEYWAQ